MFSVQFDFVNGSGRKENFSVGIFKRKLNEPTRLCELVLIGLKTAPHVENFSVDYNQSLMKICKCKEKKIIRFDQ